MRGKLLLIAALVAASCSRHVPQAQAINGWRPLVAIEASEGTVKFCSKANCDDPQNEFLPAQVVGAGEPLVDSGRVFVSTTYIHDEVNYFVAAKAGSNNDKVR